MRSGGAESKRGGAPKARSKVDIKRGGDARRLSSLFDRG